MPGVTHRVNSMQETYGLLPDQNDLISLRSVAKNILLQPGPGTKSILAGSHGSRFRGRGMDYAESRTYHPGDDVRRIDWRVTARTGITHTKTYIEERERPIILAIDFSPSMFFGSRKCLKSVTAVETGAFFGWAAISNGDRIGGVISGIDGIRDLKPTAGRRGALKLIKVLMEESELPKPAENKDQASHLVKVCEHLSRVVHPGSLVILVSDFYGLDNESTRYLQRLRQHNDMILCEVSDPLEKQAPKPGRYAITNGLQTSFVSTITAESRHNYSEFFRTKHQQVSDLADKLSILNIEIQNGEDIGRKLISIFNRRGQYAARA